MPAAAMPVTVEVTVLSPAQSRQPSEGSADLVASGGGRALLVAVGGSELVAPVELDWLSFQRWARGGADPEGGFDWLLSLAKGSRVRLVGRLEPAPRYNKEKSDLRKKPVYEGQWQLNVQRGEKLEAAAVASSSFK